jgi:anti-sigma factor RsiW
MTPLLTCKDFLHELSEYLDETIDAELRAKLERHITECPNCWVIAVTTRKSIKIYKGLEQCSIPADVESRLMKALEKKMAAKSREIALRPAQNKKGSK